MPSVLVRIIDSESGALLEGATVQLADSEGTVVGEARGVDGQIMFSTLDPELAEDPELGVGFVYGGPDAPTASKVVRVESLPPGAYAVRTSVPPVLEAGATETEDGGVCAMRICFRPAERRVRIVASETVSNFDLLHERSGETQTVRLGDEPDRGSEEEAGRGGRGGLDLLGLFGREAGFRRAFRRDHELSDSEVLTVSRACAAAIVAIVVLFAWLAAPLVSVVLTSVWALPAEGFGLRFAAGNLSGYLSSYLFSGWSAVGLLAETYPELGPGPLVAFAVSAAALAAIIAATSKWFASRLVPVNPILSALPPVGGNGEFGTARIVTDRAEVVESLGSVAEGEVSPDPGMYVGFYNPDPRYLLARSLADDARARGARAPHVEPIPQAERVGRALRGEYVHLPAEKHTIILGDTGAGKTRRLLLTTIVHILRNPKESAIIFDPKGELYGLLKTYLESIGVECVRIDFKNPDRSSRWNMLDLAIEAWERNDYSKASQLVNEVIMDLAPESDFDGPSDYFNRGARADMRSAALKMIADPRCPREQKTIATVARLVEAYFSPVPLDSNPKNQQTFVPWAEILEELEVDHPAIEAYSGARTANDKELKCFVSTVQTFLALFRDPALESMTSATDNPFRNIAMRRQAVFLIVPEKKAYAPFATMYLNQAYTALVDVADEGGDVGGVKVSGRLPQRVNFICEELCSIRKWDNLMEATNIARGRNMRFFLIVQNLSLFEAKYEDDAQGILGNMGNTVFIKTGDINNTAKWMSTIIGPYTTRVASTTYSGGRLSPILMSKSVNYTYKERSLNPDEIYRWRADYGSIALTGGFAHVVPLPDVSRTPTQEECGLGDVQHNLEKIYDAMFGGPAPCREKAERWYPELTKVIEGKRYTDAERRRERDKYIRKLAKQHRDRAYQKPAAESGARTIGLLGNPWTLEVKEFHDMTSYANALTSRKFEGWLRTEVSTLAEVEEWKKGALAAHGRKLGSRPRAKPVQGQLAYDFGADDADDG